MKQAYYVTVREKKRILKEGLMGTFKIEPSTIRKESLKSLLGTLDGLLDCIRSEGRAILRQVKAKQKEA